MKPATDYTDKKLIITLCVLCAFVVYFPGIKGRPQGYI